MVLRMFNRQCSVTGMQLESVLIKMNESNISDDDVCFNVPASKRRRRIMSSSSESSNNDFDYDTQVSDTESEDNEEVDEVGPSNNVSDVSEEWVAQNAERPPFTFTAHPGKTFNTPSKKVPLFYLSILIKCLQEHTMAIKIFLFYIIFISYLFIKNFLVLIKMNESNISDDDVCFNVPASKRRRRIMSSSSESSNNDFDYDTQVSDTESEDNEEVDEVGPSNNVSDVSEEWVAQNAERPPFTFTAHPGKTFK
ncbi:hypothetical protein FQA39_LY13599 [Lamprigera yunnana]|nr:hypothetical protein FQA39_LY13599 [Lamprigera yunnana]